LQPIGAEANASWAFDSSGQEGTFCCFNAVLRDYARLGRLLIQICRDGIPREIGKGKATALMPPRPPQPQRTEPSRRAWGHGNCEVARRRPGISLQAVPGLACCRPTNRRLSPGLRSQGKVDDEFRPRVMLVDAEARTSLSDERTNDFDPDAAVAFNVEGRWQTATFITD
jgi:hypothetical protein